MPDLTQAVVLALAIVPGFVAAQVQSFVGLGREVSSFDKTLVALIYSPILYLVAAIGSWGPQFSPALSRVVAGQITSVVDPDLLMRYVALLALAAVVGLVLGRSLVSGVLRRTVAALTGRNVIDVTWHEFFRDRSGRAIYFRTELGGIAGVPIAASAHKEERIVILAHPKWVLSNGQLVSMNLKAAMLNTADAKLVGEIPPSELRQKLRAGEGNGAR